MASQRTLEIRITRNQSMEVLSGVLTYEIMDLKATTYHKFTFPDGKELYVNDFGVSSVLKQYER